MFSPEDFLRLLGGIAGAGRKLVQISKKEKYCQMEKKVLSTQGSILQLITYNTGNAATILHYHKASF